MVNFYILSVLFLSGTSASACSCARQNQSTYSYPDPLPSSSRKDSVPTSGEDRALSRRKALPRQDNQKATCAYGTAIPCTSARIQDQVHCSQQASFPYITPLR